MNVNIVGYSKVSHFNMEFNLVMHCNQFGKHHLLSLTQLMHDLSFVVLSIGVCQKSTAKNSINNKIYSTNKNTFPIKVVNR